MVDTSLRSESEPFHYWENMTLDLSVVLFLPLLTKRDTSLECCFAFATEEKTWHFVCLLFCFCHCCENITLRLSAVLFLPLLWKHLLLPLKRKHDTSFVCFYAFATEEKTWHLILVCSLAFAIADKTTLHLFAVLLLPLCENIWHMSPVKPLPPWWRNLTWSLSLVSYSCQSRDTITTSLDRCVVFLLRKMSYHFNRVNFMVINLKTFKLENTNWRWINQLIVLLLCHYNSQEVGVSLILQMWRTYRPFTQSPAKYRCWVWLRSVER